MKQAYWIGARPLSALVALGLAACGARSDLLYGGDEVGAAGRVPEFTGELPPGRSSGGAAGSLGMLGGGARGGAAGSSGVAGRGGSDDPPDPVPQSDCNRTGGVFSGDVVASDTDDLRVLEGCTSIDGNLTLFGTRLDYQVIRSLRRVHGKLRISRANVLDGLEQISRADELSLENVTAATLAPLANLQELDTLSIIRSELRSLFGLAGVRALRQLTISGSTLASLQGLSVSGHLARIGISRSSIGSLSGLERIEEVDQLSLSEVSELTSLAGLDGLKRAESITLASNPNLTSVDTLSGLTTLDGLSVTDNASLQRLPEFAVLSGLTDLDLKGNALLQNTPSFAGLTRIGRISIVQNPSLAAVSFPFLEEVGPAGPTSNLGPLGMFDVSENDSLSEVSAPRLASAGRLFIGKNPVLARVALSGLLSSRDELSVVLNRQLPRHLWSTSSMSRRRI